MTAAQALHSSAPARASRPAPTVLSVVEIQTVLRDVIARRDRAVGIEAPPSGEVWAGSRCGVNLRLDRRWVAVLAAHGGAGASTVALALADAMSCRERPSRLVEVAVPARSGLVAAAQRELGLDDTRCWRRGTRGSCTVLRRTSTSLPQGWPETGVPAITVVDVGLPGVEDLAGLAGDGARMVVVCRATVPGVRACEQVLSGLPDARVLVAAVGADRWPGPVVAACGPHVRAAREQRRLVAVPQERRLQVAGLTAGPLPRSVAAAGRALLDLLATERDDSECRASTASPLRQKGASR